MSALLDGKKVGDRYGYLYLNIDGEIMTEELQWREGEALLIGYILTISDECRILPEEGP
jgi:hypothetical protein